MEVPQHRLDDAVLWPNSSPLKLYPASLSGRSAASSVRSTGIKSTQRAGSAAVQTQGLATGTLSHGLVAAGRAATSPLRSTAQARVAPSGATGTHTAAYGDSDLHNSWRYQQRQGAAAPSAAVAEGATVLQPADHLLNTGLTRTAGTNSTWCSSLEKQRSCALITMQQRIAALERDLLAAAQQQAQQARQMGLLRQQHQEELLSLQAEVHEQDLQWRQHLGNVAARKSMQRLLRNVLQQWHQLCHFTAGGPGDQEVAPTAAAGGGGGDPAAAAAAAGSAALQHQDHGLAQHEQQVASQGMHADRPTPAPQAVAANVTVSCSTSSLAVSPSNAQGTKRAAAWSERRMLQRVLQEWRAHRLLQQRGRQLLARRQRRHLKGLLEAWKDHVCCSRRRQLAASILRGVQRQVQLSRGWAALRLHQLEQQLAAWLAARRQHAALRAWHGWAFCKRQDELVVLAQRARAEQRLMVQAWQRWLDWVQAERRQALQLQLLQEQEAAAAAGTACSALQVQLEALQQRLQLLEQQQSQVVEDARLACAATVPGLQLLPDLEWDPPQYDPSLLRARHVTLPVHMTHPALSATMTAGTLLGAPASATSAAAAGGTTAPQALLMLGGVQGDDWCTDAVLVCVQRSQLGQPPLVVLEGVEQQVLQPWRTTAAATTTAAGTLRAAGTVTDAAGDPAAAGDMVHPLHRRDHAGCACGPNQLVVVGGYDGTAELMDVHLCSVVAEPGDASSSNNSSSGGAAEAVEDGTGLSQGGADVSGSGRHHSSSSSSIRCTATWQQMEPQHGCTPSGRSHHSVCYHAGSGCLYVFGGYSSRSGLLNEVWQFHLGLREWWEPEVTGQGPSHRRSHAAAVIGDHLYVHGGWSGGEHLGDMWRLDLTTWAWEQVAAPGAPSARRSHAALVLQERFLVVHGGYDGARYLSDMHVYDTLSQAWISPLLHRPWDRPPAACALHTLTLLGADLVLLGGANTGGLTGQVQLLHSVAAQQGQLLQARLLQLVEELSAAQQQGVQGDADLECWRLQAAQHEQQLRVLQESNDGLAARCNTLAADCRYMHKRCAATKAAQEATAVELAAAREQLQAVQSGNATLSAKVAVLERRLARARAAGSKAAAAAAGMVATAQAAEGKEQQMLALQLELRQVAAKAVQHEEEIGWLREQLAEAQRSQAALLQHQQQHNHHHGNFLLRSPAGRFSRPAGSPAAMSAAAGAVGGGASELARTSSRAVPRSGQASVLDLGSLPPSGQPSPAGAAAAAAPSRASSGLWPIQDPAAATDGHAAGTPRPAAAAAAGDPLSRATSSACQQEPQQVSSWASAAGQHDTVCQGSPVQQQQQQQELPARRSGQMASSSAAAAPTAVGDVAAPADTQQQAQGIVHPCPQEQQQQQQSDDSSAWQQPQPEMGGSAGGGYTYMEGLVAEDVLDHLQQLQQELQEQQQEAAASAAEQRSLLHAQLQLTQQAHSLEVHQLQQQLHQAKWRAWSAEADAAQLAAVLAGDPAGPRPLDERETPAGALGAVVWPSELQQHHQQQQQQPSCLEDTAAAPGSRQQPAGLRDTSAGAGQGSPGTAHDSSAMASSTGDPWAPGGARLGADVGATLGASTSGLQPSDSSDALLPEVQELLSLYSRIQCTAA